ncbi:MAG: hypothetical protein ACI9VR_003815 [Cognaticolwellia sp.]|jgi:hypothetical protein
MGSTRYTGAVNRRDLFILTVVLLQGLIPLHYYLGVSHSYDERFAWRMFSETRLVSCQVQFRADGEEIALKRTFHSAWITLLRRGRPSVVQGVQDRVCATHSGQEITLLYRCRQMDGEAPVFNDGSKAVCP